MKRLWWFLSIGLIIFAFAIRLFQVTSSPPSPYWEEAALGYDAYSILQTGKDHHGNPWPVVAFESFGDWKPSGYFYALVPFIKFFGLNVLAVRMPSVMAGTLIVVGLGVLMWQLSAKIIKDQQRPWLVLLTMFLATLSPWLIQFSRGGWEVNLATALILWGVISGYQAFTTKQKQKIRFLWLSLSTVLLFASAYTYHSARILAPILGLLIVWQFFRQDLQAKGKNIWLVGYLLPIFLVAVLARPFITAWGTGALNQRVAETSIFSDLSVIEESNQLQDLHNHSLLSRVMYHRYVLFGIKATEKFFSHFDLNFLFISGDVNPRHSSQYFGLFYPFEVIFLLIGAGWVIQHLAKEQKTLLFTWLVMGILPASITLAAPHALRILPTAPVFILFLSFGLWQVMHWPVLRKWRTWWIAGLLVLYIGTFIAFYRNLLNVYPQQYAGEWQYGYEQMVTAVNNLAQEYPDLPIYITREYGRPAMYYWFYSQTDPQLVQAAEATAKKDQGEFLEFQNMHFINSLDEMTTMPAIVAGSSDQVGQDVWTESTQINGLDNQPIWKIGIDTN